MGVLSNLFTGAADIVTPDIFKTFEKAEQTRRIDTSQLTKDTIEYFTEKGYIWTEKGGEEKLILAASVTYGDRDEIAAGLGGGQYGFITSLHCNLDCPYCFQKKQADSAGFLTRRQVDKGLKVIAQCEEAVSKALGKPSLPKISITGGEPMLPNAANIKTLDYLLERLEDLGWPYNITTNGTELERFIARHGTTPRCRNVQVTLDGPPDIHDKRRYFRGGRPSFDRIASGVDAALASGWNITLRVNLDMSNVAHLPRLATLVRERGWLDYENFSAYVSPVTDHGSIGGHEIPRDEADLLEALLAVVEEVPGVREIFDIKHFRGFNYVERILVQKKPRFPVLFRCEAVTGMYIFDPFGDVHVCLETVGNRGRRVGQYDPEWSIDLPAHTRWTDRNVLSLPGCDTCKIRFLCAGGCTLESFNKGDGNTCMPFLKEMDIAWWFFAKTQPELFPDAPLSA